MSLRDKLDPDKIKANLKVKCIGREIVVYNSTSSTQAVAAEYAKAKENNGLVIFTEQQTAGKGRSGAQWLSGRSDSLLCSIVLTDCKLNGELMSLTSAVAVAEAVGGGAKIKWPNDIIIKDKKVGGILLESKPVGGHIAHIIGIGVNCQQKKTSFSKELRSIATSLQIETGAAIDRTSLAKRLLTSMDHWLVTAEKNSKKVTRQWQKLSIQLGHRVTVIFNGKKFTGNCIGIDPQKGLILQLDRGGIRMFDAAHTSIAKEL